jgi:hypothetical protein
MKRFVVACCSLVVFGAIGACALISNTQSSTPSNTITPCNDGSSNYSWLRVGHELHYAYKGPVKSDSMLIKVVSSPSAGNYRTQVTYPGSGKSYDLYYHACGPELYTSTNGDRKQYKYWWFSIQVKVGDLWSREVPGFLYTYQLMGKNVTVKTTLLRQTIFNCYMFTGHDPFNNITDTIYFKPDAGIVYYAGVKEKYELAYKNFGGPKP